MHEQYAHYRAAGRSREQVLEWQQQAREFHQQTQELRNEVGANAVAHYNHQRIAGFEFEGDPPPNWKQNRHGLWWPKRNSKAGRELDDRIQAVRHRSLQDALGYGGLMVVGTAIFGCTLEPYPGSADGDDDYIIGVPRTNGAGSEPFFVPEDAEPIKLSEYFALKGE